jgi:predicted membrane channel-forming protein YqfA (hemolysin III family)
VKLDNRAILIFVTGSIAIVALVAGAGGQWGFFAFSLVVLAVCGVGMYRTHRRRKADWAEDN